LGAWAIGGGGWEFGWGPQEDDASIAAIHRALELGLNWIDAAAACGFGHSEEVVGRALAGVSYRPYVFTKCSLLEGPGRRVIHNLKRDSVLREAEASLERLGVDAIDLYQIHWPNPERDIESNLLPYCAQEGIGVIVYSPMGSGLLTGRMTRERIEAFPDDDWRREDSRFQEPALSDNLELVERLAAVGRRHGVEPGAVAVAWTLCRPEVDGAIVGFRRPDQVDPILPATTLELTHEDVAEVEGASR
jgi:aryl-alcohol dehydrogenase-like predicted oxidoreductase